VIGSVMQDAPPASATPPLGDTVYEPDPISGDANSQVRDIA